MKKLILTVAVLFGALGLMSTAHADIFAPIDPAPVADKVAAPTAFNSATLLTDAAAVINYLGVKEGESYNFAQHRFVTTTGATIITYAPWNLSLDVQMLNDDGVTGNIAWNLGAYLPVQNVPIMNLTQYLYVTAGIGGEENEAGTAFKLAPTLGAEFKFSF